MDLYNNYSKRVEENRSEYLKSESYSSKLSNLRLFILLGGSALTYYAFTRFEPNLYGYGLLLCTLVIFLFLVVKHDKIINETNRYRNMAEINEKCLLRMDGNWEDFADDGAEFINPAHSYTEDLDIFGRASLFQWINTCNTYGGKEILRSLLENPDMNRDLVKQRQEAVKELASKLEFCQTLQCEGMGGPKLKNNPEYMLGYAEDTSALFSQNWLKATIWCLPLLTILSFLVWYFTGSISIYFFLSFLSLQSLIIILLFKQINKALGTVYTYRTNVGIYQRILEIIEKERFNDAYLASLQSSLFQANEPASQQINKLDSIVGAIALRANPIVHFVFNFVLLWDLHCVLALENWKEKSGQSLRHWLDTLSWFEALSSLSLIAQLNPQWAFPQILEREPLFSAQALGHPLISKQKRITNDFVLDQQVGIITGSNMSGKTTLLRTVGINLVLAYAGAPVCARELKCSLMDIFTSMRITDDLSSGISTFYAELLRIKTIIDYSQKEKPMIFLLDEVFRGTNSNDRIVGARNVLVNLNKSWVIGLISTHDFELCALENSSNGRVVNYHFTETYSGNKIEFDYRIRPGRCTTTNAQYLMKMVGIELEQ
ncbi:MAG: DNA mismatch repair protein MutS [Syntrophomonas sp.]|nr:DNA mismatch repair protein MutS [Syntrophomonas sp.]